MMEQAARRDFSFRMSVANAMAFIHVDLKRIEPTVGVFCDNLSPV